MTTDPSSHLFSGRRNGQQTKPPLAVRMFASFGGAGYFPIASGTVGSAAALIPYWLLPAADTDWILGILCIVCFIAGIPAANIMERFHGDDPSQVVLDEAVGMWISLLLLPKTIGVAVAAFLLFRLFDIFKPWPANRFDRMRGGFGIMMDDVAAGIYANIVLHIGLAIEPIQQLLSMK